MSNKRNNRKRDFFKNIEEKSEAEKLRLVWLGAISFMILFFGLWVSGAKSNFARLADYKVDYSSLPSFPENQSTDLAGILDESGEKIGGYMEENNTEWQALGDNYIEEQGILSEEGFSSLKFVGTESDGDAVLIKYAEYYKDIPVLGCDLVLSVDMDDNIAQKENNLVSGIDLVVDPKISLKAAGEIAEKECIDGGCIFKEGGLAIAKYEEGFYLVWKITLISDEAPSVKEVLVGAERGGIVSTVGEDETEEVNQTSNIAE